MKPFLLQIPFWVFLAWLSLHIRQLKRRGRRSPLNESILRLPGTALRARLTDEAFDASIYMFGVLAAPLFFYSAVSANQFANKALLVVGAIATITLLVLAARKFRRVFRMHIGLDAETAVGQELNLLMRDGAWVFHDIPYQYGNIDHLVIGIGGLFAVETKGVSKPTDDSRSPQDNSKVSVSDGAIRFPHVRTKQPIEQAKTHANWLRNEIQRRFGISARVVPVVALPGWNVSGGFDGDCWVINPKRGNALRTAVTKPILDQQSVTMIAAWVEDLARSIQPKSKDFDPISG